jgi:hypothetical protein
MRCMSRSKHQTIKSVIDGQSKSQVSAMFSEGDHDAMELVAKRHIKKQVRLDRSSDKLTEPD